jgi:hypothetical protein
MWADDWLAARFAADVVRASNFGFRWWRSRVPVNSNVSNEAKHFIPSTTSLKPRHSSMTILSFTVTTVPLTVQIITTAARNHAVGLAFFDTPHWWPNRTMHSRGFGAGFGRDKILTRGRRGKSAHHLIVSIDSTWSS